MTTEALEAVDEVVSFLGRAFIKLFILLIVFVIVPTAFFVVGIGQGSVTVWLISPVLWIAVIGRPFIREWLYTRKEKTSCW